MKIDIIDITKEGGGINRLIMRKYGIPDVRMLYSGDLRVVSQF